MTDHEDNDGSHVTRRTVMGLGGGITLATVLPIPWSAEAQDAPDSTLDGTGVRISMEVNGVPAALEIDARASLLDVLRERLGLTGTKKGCDHGQCGACTVHLDGRTAVSCLTLAAKANGRAVTTVEGLSSDGSLHAMQRAFVDHDALQCGYCTPGQIMSAVACLQREQAGSTASIREFMSGNICRCGAYPGIVAAIESVALQARDR